MQLWQIKMINNLFPITKVGFKYITIAFSLFLIFEIFDFDFLAIIAFISLVAFVYIFRNPEREVPSFLGTSLVSPVDGVIVSINELVDDEYAYAVKIDSNLMSVGVLRSPMDASVKSVKVFRGTRISKDKALHEDINEYAQIEFSDISSNLVKIVHRLKQSFAPISIDVIPDQNLKQSARYGNVFNGTTTVYIPQNFRLNVNVGNELKASESLLGYFS